MKKKYTKPEAYKLEFDYREQIVACSGQPEQKRNDGCFDWEHHRKEWWR